MSPMGRQPEQQHESGNDHDPAAHSEETPGDPRQDSQDGRYQDPPPFHGERVYVRVPSRPHRRGAEACGWP